MRLLKFHLCMLLVILGFTAGLSSCSPVKQVLKDPEKFAQVRDTVFARGLCLNDTVTTEVVRDTTIYTQVAGPTDTVHINVPCEFDKTVKGTRVVLKNGVLSVEPKIITKTQLKTVVKTNTVRDKSREGVLEKQLVQNEASAKERYDKLASEKQKLEIQVHKRNTQRIWLLGIVIALGVWTVRKPIAALIL